MKTYTQYLTELKTNKKAEAALDKVMSGKDGDKLAKALANNEEDKAMKILKANKLKGNLLDDVLAVMFGDL